MTTVFNRRSASEAFDWINALPRVHGVETLPLAEAAGRILSRTITTPGALPASSVAAIDGYAVASATTLGSSDYNPLPLRLQSESRADFQAGDARLIQVGERLPVAADAVVSLDTVELVDDSLEVTAGVASGAGTLAAGEDYAAETTLFSAGHRLRAQDLALLAQIGLEQAPVYACPRILLLLAGRFEHDANGPMLQALIQGDGGRVIGRIRVADNSALQSALLEADCDLLMVVGASGLAAQDYALESLARAGEVAFYGVAINPGESVALGRRGAVPVIVLPGTPLACLCAYDLIGTRIVRRLARQPGSSPYATTRARLRSKVASSIGRTEVCRVRLDGDEAEPLAIAENRLLSSAIDADGFIVVPEHSEGHPAATEVTVFLYHSACFAN